MSRTPTPEHEAWLAAYGMELADEAYGHWVEGGFQGARTKRSDNGFRDLTHTAEGRWFAMFFRHDDSGSCWEGPEFDAPEVAWVHAELSNWGQP